ncbi:hypothetical protein [Candidatus Ichthyocystis hellenicum]|uniref:hypothetical protein n=1 Tax=Candidatus Ichthyocystis hellenicum TaxID=1561003 RepID=UPI0012FD05FB|nr:hypothetical protein [Candidatus Ichthyocystis hellenicum]
MCCFQFCSCVWVEGVIVFLLARNCDTQRKIPPMGFWELPRLYVTSCRWQTIEQLVLLDAQVCAAWIPRDLVTA